jgi:hypothetical protein
MSLGRHSFCFGQHQGSLSLLSLSETNLLVDGGEESVLKTTFAVDGLLAKLSLAHRRRVLILILRIVQVVAHLVDFM